MRVITNYLIPAIIVFVFLLCIFALDDSYEDANLSAQLLDEAIAQAWQQRDESTEKNQNALFMDKVLLPD